MSAKTKFKLTAHEGCRVRKVALVSLASAGPEERVENCLACLTNLGDIHIFTVPSLRPQVHYGCIRKEDISGIASCVFTKHGQGEGPAPYRPHLFFFFFLLGGFPDGPRSLPQIPCRFLLDLALRVRALLAQRQERDGAAVLPGGLPAAGHLLPQVGCAGGSLQPRGLVVSPLPVPAAPTSPRVSFQQLDGDAEAAASQRHPRPAQPRGQPFPLRQ